MTCPMCGKEFEPRRRDQRYCTPACRAKANSKIGSVRREITKRQFEREWAAWKRDFALGKTVSNLEVSV